MKSLDTILVLSLIATAFYSFFYAENKEMMLIYCLVGLYLVNTIGRYTSKKIALINIQIDITEREKKREEQRTLMRTRHTTVR